MSKLISFPDCPYDCVDGQVYNTVLNIYETCPYCAEKRKEMVQDESNTKTEDGENIFDILRINEYYRGIEYTFDKVLSDTSYFIPEPLKLLQESLDDLYNRLSIGDIPKSSYLYNLGAKANIYNFVYPYIIKAYKYGIPTTPVLSTVDLMESQMNLEKGISKEYIDYVSTKISVVILNAGASYIGVRVLKGYMQERAKRGNPTLIFTTSKIENSLLTLVNESDTDVLHLAKLLTVVYTKSEETVGHTESEPTKDRVITMEEMFNMI